MLAGGGCTRTHAPCGREPEVCPSSIVRNALESATTYMDLLALAPRIREAVGDERFAMLDRILHD